MAKEKKSTINVQGTEITILSTKEDDYISLTDMVKNFDGGSSLIEQWMKNKDRARVQIAIDVSTA